MAVCEWPAALWQSVVHPGSSGCPDLEPHCCWPAAAWQSVSGPLRSTFARSRASRASRKSTASVAPAAPAAARVAYLTVPELHCGWLSALWQIELRARSGRRLPPPSPRIGPPSRDSCNLAPPPRRLRLRALTSPSFELAELSVSVERQAGEVERGSGRSLGGRSSASLARVSSSSSGTRRTPPASPTLPALAPRAHHAHAAHLRRTHTPRPHHPPAAQAA